MCCKSVITSYFLMEKDQDPCDSLGPVKEPLTWESKTIYNKNSES